MKIPFRKIVSFLLLIVFLTGINACVPMSKESYLAMFADFIEKTQSEYTNYSEADWAESDLVFEKFNGIWFTNFEDEFTIKDHLQISKFKIEYNFLKLKHNSKDLFQALGFNDYEDLKKQLKFYLKNDMEQDVQDVINQAKIMGDSAIIRVDNILKDFESEK